MGCLEWVDVAMIDGANDEFQACWLRADHFSAAATCEETKIPVSVLPLITRDNTFSWRLV